MIKIINGVNVYKTDEKCLIEMVKNNPDVLKKLPKEVLTENICNQAIICDWNCYKIIPENFRTINIKTTLFIYWSEYININKVLNIDEINEVLFIIFTQYRNKIKIPKQMFTTALLEKLINYYEDSDFLKSCSYIVLLRKDDNVKKLYQKYGKSFLKNLYAIIPESFYNIIIKEIPDCQYQDFNSKYISDNLKAMMFKNSNMPESTPDIPKEMPEVKNNKQKITNNSQKVIENYYDAVVLIIDYLTNLKSTKTNYCQEKNIHTQIIDKKLNIIRLYNPNLYNLYNELLTLDINKLHNIEYLKNYLIDELSKKESTFNIIDYCLLTDLPIDIVYQLLLNANQKKLQLSNSENNLKEILIKLRILCTSIQKNKNIDIQAIIINGKYFNINESLSEEEKNKIFVFMFKNNISLNQNNYHQTLIAYFNGTINIDNIEPKKISTGYIEYQQELATKLNNYIRSFQNDPYYQVAYNKLNEKQEKTLKKI